MPAAGAPAPHRISALSRPRFGPIGRPVRINTPKRKTPAGRRAPSSYSMPRSTRTQFIESTTISTRRLDFLSPRGSLEPFPTTLKRPAETPFDDR